METQGIVSALCYVCEAATLPSSSDAPIVSAPATLKPALPAYEVLLRDCCNHKLARRRPDLRPRGSKRSSEGYFANLALDVERRMADVAGRYYSSSARGETVAFLLFEMLEQVGRGGCTAALELVGVLLGLSAVTVGNSLDANINEAVYGPIGCELLLKWQQQQSLQSAFAQSSFCPIDVDLLRAGGLKTFMPLNADLDNQAQRESQKTKLPFGYDDDAGSWANSFRSVILRDATIKRNDVGQVQDGDLFGALIRSKLDCRSEPYQSIQFRLSFPDLEESSSDLINALLQSTPEGINDVATAASREVCSSAKVETNDLYKARYFGNVSWMPLAIFDSIADEWQNTTQTTCGDRFVCVWEAALECLRCFSQRNSTFRRETGLTMECLQNIMDTFEASCAHRKEIQSFVDDVECSTSSPVSSAAHAAAQAFVRAIRRILELADVEVTTLSDSLRRERTGDGVSSVTHIIQSSAVLRGILLRLHKFCKPISIHDAGWEIFDRVYNELQLMQLTSLDLVHPTSQDAARPLMQSYNNCLLSLLFSVSNPLFASLQDVLYRCKGVASLSGALGGVTNTQHANIEIGTEAIYESQTHLLPHFLEASAKTRVVLCCFLLQQLQTSDSHLEMADISDQAHMFRFPVSGHDIADHGRLQLYLQRKIHLTRTRTSAAIRRAIRSTAARKVKNRRQQKENTLTPTNVPVKMSESKTKIDNKAAPVQIRPTRAFNLTDTTSQEVTSLPLLLNSKPELVEEAKRRILRRFELKMEQLDKQKFAAQWRLDAIQSLASRRVRLRELLSADATMNAGSTQSVKSEQLELFSNRKNGRDSMGVESVRVTQPPGGYSQIDLSSNQRSTEQRVIPPQVNAASSVSSTAEMPETPVWASHPLEQESIPAFLFGRKEKTVVSTASTESTTKLRENELMGSFGDAKDAVVNMDTPSVRVTHPPGGYTQIDLSCNQTSVQDKIFASTGDARASLSAFANNPASSVSVQHAHILELESGPAAELEQKSRTEASIMNAESGKQAPEHLSGAKIMDNLGVRVTQPPGGYSQMDLSHQENNLVIAEKFDATIEHIASGKSDNEPSVPDKAENASVVAGFVEVPKLPPPRASASHNDHVEQEDADIPQNDEDTMSKSETQDTQDQYVQNVDALELEWNLSKLWSPFNRNGALRNVLLRSTDSNRVASATMIPLDVLMNECVCKSLELQCTLIENVALDFFLAKEQLLVHVRSVQTLMLLTPSGDATSYLCRNMFDFVTQSSTVLGQNMFDTHVTMNTAVLEQLWATSLQQATLTHTKDSCIKLRWTPSSDTNTLSPPRNNSSTLLSRDKCLYNSSTFDSVTIDYEASYPLSLMLTRSFLDNCKRINKALWYGMQLHTACARAYEAFRRMERETKVASVNHRSLVLALRLCQHFSNTWTTQVANTILSSYSWLTQRLRSKSSRMHSPVQLRDLLEAYTLRMLHGCVVTAVEVPQPELRFAAEVVEEGRVIVLRCLGRLEACITSINTQSSMAMERRTQLKLIVERSLESMDKIFTEIRQVFLRACSSTSTIHAHGRNSLEAFQALFG